MEFLGYKMTMRGLETVAQRFERYAPDTVTNLRRVTVACVRATALDAAKKAEEAESAAATARQTADSLRGDHNVERQGLAEEARAAREAALDMPTRRRELEKLAAAEQAEKAITELDEADRAAAAELGPLENHAAGAMRHFAQQARAFGRCLSSERCGVCGCPPRHAGRGELTLTPRVTEFERRSIEASLLRLAA